MEGKKDGWISHILCVNRALFFYPQVNDDEKFLPCEIALLQFNLQDGIIDTFHTFIKPPNEAIPLGYGYEISKNADDTHGITLDDDPMYHQNR